METLDRRAFLSRGALLLTLPSALAAAGCRQAGERPLSPISANWVLTLHPVIEQVNDDFRAGSDASAVVALPTGDPIEDFVREAAVRTSTWDTFIGITPWVEMARLVDLGVIEPWDAYITADMLKGLPRKIRAEATFRGHLYSWPFLVDVVVQGYNGELLERAGLDPMRAPATWDEYISNARTVVEAGAAPYGCTFDPNAWRSLVPIAHSLASDLYTEDGLFDLTHSATVEALELMRRMLEHSPDVLEPGAVISPDEAAFGAETVGYSIKYQNAHVRQSLGWTDPTRLHLDALPANGGPGGTVFWTVGLALLRFGKHKADVSDYAEHLTHDERVWRASLGTDFDAAGQLPAFTSLPGWESPRPTWMASWVPGVTKAFRTASAIRPHPLGAQQFDDVRPYWEEYLLGSERSPRRALAKAMRAVRDRAAAIG